MTRRAQKRRAGLKPGRRAKAAATPRLPRETPQRDVSRAVVPRERASPRDVSALDRDELEALRKELERRLAQDPPSRWNVDPEEAQRALAKLVLSLVEFLRELMERQAIRRMEAGTLTADQTEAVGVALMRLEETVRELAVRFGLSPADLNLELGPLGKLR